ncbi:MAG TPA: hypothetical protein PLH97_11920, partial [Verrucomicrobiota bacterium]|nr:hypothetical protein [Verrucomicrobiota bacterium]
MRRNQLRIPPLAFSCLVLAAGLGLTVFATYYAARSVHLATARHFDTAVQYTEEGLLSRMETYATLLRGVAALFAVNPDISLSEFRR